MESTNTNLIEWSEIANKEIKGDKLNPIDKFLYENEPAGKEQSDLFRKQFLEAINYKSSAGKNELNTSEQHLPLGDVSGQRELLLAFKNYHDEEPFNACILEAHIEVFLEKANNGR